MRVRPGLVNSGLASFGIRWIFPARRDHLLVEPEEKVLRSLDVLVIQILAVHHSREVLPDEVDHRDAVYFYRSVGVHASREAAVGALVVRRRNVLEGGHGTENEDMVDSEASAKGITLLVQER